MNNFTEIKVYYGCPRKKGLKESRQPKKLSQKWFIYWSHRHPTTGEFKRVRIYGDINKFTSIDRRVAEAKSLIRIYSKMLADGYSPFSNPFGSDNKKFYTITEGLEYALKIKVADMKNKGSVKEYNSYTLKFIDVLRELGYAFLPVPDIKREHVKAALTKYSEGKSNATYNRLKMLMSNLFDILVDESFMILNPTFGIKNKKHVKQHFKSATPEQKKLISEHILKQYPEFHLCVSMIYTLGIRITEVTQLKLSDIYPEKNYLIVRAEISKNGKLRVLPLVGSIKTRLIQLYNEYPNDWFLFGGKFKPAPKNVYRTTVSDVWDRLVKTDLKIDLNIYGMKHTGAYDKIMAGMSLESVSKLFGHSDTEVTQIYTGESLALKAAEELSKLADEF